MPLKNLVEKWEKNAKEIELYEEINIKLPLQEAAKIKALAEMYPGHGIETLIADLLKAGLEELEATLPYVKGPKVIAEDEMGDPIYEDVGPTPRFQKLTQKFLQQFEHLRASKTSLPADK